MGSADVNLKVDRPDRLLFAHSPLRALVFAVIAGGFAWVGWRYAGDDSVFRYAFTAFAGLFVLVGVLGVFWRLELDIDLGTRTVRKRSGFWPFTRTGRRPLDDAEGVVLRVEYRSSGTKNNKRKVPWWFVSIRFPEEKEKGTRIFATTSEVDGYGKWEYFARRLQLDAIDATESAEGTRKRWNELDETLAAQEGAHAQRPQHVPGPPPDAGLDVIYTEGRKEIVIPATGFNGGLVFLFLFGAVFAAMGSVPLLAGLGLIEIDVSGSKAALAIVPPVFILAGLGIVWLGIRGSYSAMVIGVNNGELFTETLAFGKRSGRQAIALAEVESIGIRGDVGSRRRKPGHVTIGGVRLGNRGYRDRDNEIVVRADQHILRFGRNLNDAARDWLGDVCRYAVAHGQLP